MVNPIDHWLWIPFGTGFQIPLMGLSSFRGIGSWISLRGLSGYRVTLGLVVPALEPIIPCIGDGTCTSSIDLVSLVLAHITVRIMQILVSPGLKSCQEFCCGYKYL